MAAADILYQEDFTLWAAEQAERLRDAARDGSNLPLDWENLAEEVESLGRSERRELRSLVHQIIAHLLKLAHSRTIRVRVHWESEVSLLRRRLQLCLEDSPSLRPGLGQVVEDEISRAQRTAADSLDRHGEPEAAAQVRQRTLVVTAENILEDQWFLDSIVEAGGSGHCP